ncbi:MAG: carboxypeptidase M32 [bacterium]|nr:carboxypeptidase M32 [bacterium]
MMSIKILRERIRKIGHYEAMAALLDWDQNTYMPAKAAGDRALLMEEATRLSVELFLADQTGELIEAAEAGTLTPTEKNIVKIVKREYIKNRKIPSESHVRLKGETARAFEAWRAAKEENDFSRFAPALEKVLEICREQADSLGYQNEPYDAMLDLYEPGIKAAEVETIIRPLQECLTGLLGDLDNGGKPDVFTPAAAFPLQLQEELNHQLLKLMHFDLEGGQLSTAPHPFTITMSPGDVRITTRYNKHDPFSSLLGTAHEAGHGLYEQGIPEDLMLWSEISTPSLGIHESQSRFWENGIVRSLDFWKCFYPRLLEIFPVFKQCKVEDLWRSLNRVEPSLIRVEADEVTYNLHIMLRFEIERELLNGKVPVSRLPELWNEKMKSYLGIEPSTDSEGVLQDVHWSMGLFGYFPTYMLGNLYSAQFSHKMVKDIPDLSAAVAEGRLEVPLQWLRTNIHNHGNIYQPGELVKMVTGESLNINYFTDYIKSKYHEIYRL